MKKNGFLFFEVMIAIMVASVLLVVIMQGLGASFKASRLAEEYFRVDLLASSQMELLEKQAAYKDEVTHGNFSRETDPNQIYKWELKISPIISSLMSYLNLPVSEVRLTIRWKDYVTEIVSYVAKYEESSPER